MQGSARIDELRQKFHENPRRYFAPLANEYRKAGDPEQAIAICRAHLAQQPGHMSGHVVYGQALYDAKRIDESRTVFEKALSLDPDNAIVLRHLGDIARQRGETAEAKHWYGRAFDADPNNAEIAAYIAELTEPLTESALPLTDLTDVAAGTAEPVDASALPAESAASEVAAFEASESESAAASEPDAMELVDMSSADTRISETVEEEVKTEETQPTAGASEAVESTARDTVDVSDTHADEQVSAVPTDIEEPKAPSDEEVSEMPAAAEASEQPADVAASSEKGERPRSDTPVDTPIIPLADVSWRKSPPHEDSPFVTRTMAELYAKQGYRAAALDVYRQLSLINPDDQEIFARIRELSGKEGSSHEADVEVESSPVSESADAEAVSREESEPAAVADDVPNEIAAQSTDEAAPVVEEPQAEPARADELTVGAPADWTNVSDEPVYTPKFEEIEPEPEAPTPSSEGRHFTEMELAPGDTWDTDTWGAGFSADESTDLELDAPDAPVAHLSPESEAAPKDAAPPSESVEATEAPVSHEAAAEPTGTAAPTDWERETAEVEPAAMQAEPASAEPEPAPTEAAPAPAEAEQSSAAEPASAQAEPPAAEEAAVAEESGVAPRSANEDFVEAERFVAAEELSLAEVEPEREAEPDREDEPHLVAYSPQPPADEDLPHYEPKGPNVREFFATLGARRPPSRESAQSFTARAAVPSLENPSDYPLAASAFADLFPDSPIADEDTRAAFALSGAMSGTPAGAENPSAAETKRNTPPSPAAPLDNNQESDEDIRRFREWLDGLAES